MYLAKILTLRSLPEIGRRFGGRDHTTVLHAVRKIEALVGNDTILRRGDRGAETPASGVTGASTKPVKTGKSLRPRPGLAQTALPRHFRHRPSGA